MLMRKHTLLCALVATLLSVLVIGAVFSFGDVAQAEVVDVVYPTTGYIQAENVDLVAVSEDYTLTYDSTNKVLSVTGKKYGTISLASTLLDTDSVTKMFVFGDCAIVRASKDYVVNLDTLAVTDTTLFEECYLTAFDGLLYCHTWGKVDVYDDTLNLTATYDDNMFKNKPVMVTDGETIFSFAVDYGINKLYTYHVATDTADEVSSIFVENAFMGDDIVAYDGTKIILIDKVDGSMSATSLTDKNYAVLGNKIYIAKGKDGYDVYAMSDDGLTFESNFSYGGEGLDKLNTPSHGIAFGDEIVVTDMGANRILFVGDNTVSLAIDTPTFVTASSERLYVKCADGIVVVDDKSIKNTIKTNFEIVDMLYADRLYVLAEDGVYTLISGSLIKVFDVEGGLAFDFNEHFYILKNRRMEVFEQDGGTSTTSIKTVEVYTVDGQVNELLSFDTPAINPVDFFVDEAGNVFVLDTANNLYCYDWLNVVKSKTMDVLLTATCTPIESDDYTYTARSMFEYGNRLVFVTNENALVSVANPAKSVVERGAVTLDGLTPALYKTDYLTYFMSDENVGSTARFVGAETTVVAYEIAGKLYTKIGGVEGWIFGALDATANAVDGEYRTKSETKIFVNPEYSDCVTLSSRTKVNIVDDACGYDGAKWYRINYNGKTYFVLRESLEKVPTIGPITPNPPQKEEEVKADYGRAKSTRAGEYVPLYESIGGDVAISVKDGTRLEIVEKVGDYYKVKCEGNEYFIHQDQFKLDGLTTVQIVAIVLSIVVVLAGSLVFAVTSLTRKKEENR